MSGKWNNSQIHFIGNTLILWTFEIVIYISTLLENNKRGVMPTCVPFCVGGKTRSMVLRSGNSNTQARIGRNFTVNVA